MDNLIGELIQFGFEGICEYDVSIQIICISIVIVMENSTKGIAVLRMQVNVD